MKRDPWLDETDAALADASQRYASERYAFDTQQRRSAVLRRFNPDAWREMATMGWLGVATGEEDGGLGLRISSIALLAQAAGRHLVNEPLLSSGFVAADVLMHHGDKTQRAQWLPAVNDGSLRLACLFSGEAAPVQAREGRLHGRQEVVLDADIADALLVEAVRADGSTCWYRVDAQAAGLERQTCPLLDGRGAASVQLGGCEAQALQAGPSEHSYQLAALALAADALGAMEAAMDLTLGYIKTRQQFGAAIGTHQVIQHRAVDMLMRLSESRAVLAQATHSLQSRPQAAARDVHAAKAFIGQQSRLLVQEAVQLHGGIGITDEYVLSHHLRRVIVDDQLLGGSEHHLRRFVASPFSR
ncbi:MAG: hypothetical protein JWQ76_1473 [Ramlibacter sp.]|nr:hypothetical protein [Ramlibacter sp.]